MINSVSQKILGVIDAGNGRVPYTTVLAAMEYQERRYLMPALRQLKANGVAQKQVRVVDGKPLFEVFRIPS